HETGKIEIGTRSALENFCKLEKLIILIKLIMLSLSNANFSKHYFIIKLFLQKKTLLTKQAK
ncbi:hypothetical protein, partial [Borreliella burgdorferi]|uniref:hypothetical protein n=1 Tax=Borreliella burgdorferi TaxID=139 RepID=UPI001E34ECBB